MTGPPRSPSAASVLASSSLANRKRSLLLRRGFGTSGSSPSPHAIAPSCASSPPTLTPPMTTTTTTTKATTTTPVDHTTTSSSSTSSAMDETPVVVVASNNREAEEREESIHVAVRFRPLNSKELSSSSSLSSSSHASSNNNNNNNGTSPRRPSIKAALHLHNNSKTGTTASRPSPSKTSSPHKTSTCKQDNLQAARAWSLVSAASATSRLSTSTTTSSSSSSTARCSTKCHPSSVIQKGAVRKVEGRTVFSFDSVFGEEASTLDVYHGLAKPLLEAVLRGQHATMFAYGQTGSGKTHTMHGNIRHSNSTSTSTTTPTISTTTTPTTTTPTSTTNSSTLPSTTTATATTTTSSSSSGGIIHMTLADMFQQMQLFPERDFRVRVSFFEIYNEKVRDLLDDGNNNSHNDGDGNDHVARQHPSTSATHHHHHHHHHHSSTSTPSAAKTTSRLGPGRAGDPNSISNGGGGASSGGGGVPVVNCREQVIHNMDQAVDILARGHAQRTSASTQMNEQSSRSHAIFRITVESCDKTPSTSSSSSSSGEAAMMLGGQVMRVAVFNLVDLSGSENARLTGNTGQRQREGGMINQSLLSLSQVIYSLSLPPKKRPSYINYRDSKLTRILQPHLSGNARIAILCCASPATRFVEETRATLMFASRAKLVQTKPQVNEVLDDKLLLKRLIRELEEARQAIRQLQQERKVEQEERQQEKEQRRIEDHERRHRQQRVVEEEVEAKVKAKRIEAQEEQKQSLLITTPTTQPSCSVVHRANHITPENPHPDTSLLTNDDVLCTPRAIFRDAKDDQALGSPSSSPLPAFPTEQEKATLTHSSVPVKETSYNLNFRPLHSDNDTLHMPLETTQSSPLFVLHEIPMIEKDGDAQRHEVTPEFASTTATPQGSSRQGTSSHSLQVTALPFRLMYNEVEEDDRSAHGSHKTGGSQSTAESSKSDVATTENVAPHASFILDRSLGNVSRQRLRSPHGMKPPSEVVIMRESSFRTLPIPTADDEGLGKNSNHSVDLRARLLDTEQRARFLESKLDASDDLIESLFVELEGARKCIQKLVHRNVHLAALWREAENTLLKEATPGTPGSRATTSDGTNDTRIRHALSEDECDDETYHRAHQRHFKMLKYAILLGLVFFLFGNTELFLAVAMFVGLTLEVNM